MTTRTVTPVSPRSADPRKYLKTVSNTECRLLDGVRFYGCPYSEPASCLSLLQPAAPPSSGSGSRPDCRIRDGDSNRCTNISRSLLPTFAALLVSFDQQHSCLDSNSSFHYYSLQGLLARPRTAERGEIPRVPRCLHSRAQQPLHPGFATPVRRLGAASSARVKH